MKIINLEDIHKTLVNLEDTLGVDVQIPIGKDDGTPAYSMRVFTVIPGGHTPYHKHEFEHINYVISGKGVINTEDGPYLVKEGDCMLIPPYVVHNYENMSEYNGQNLVFICLVPKEFECGCPDDL